MADREPVNLGYARPGTVRPERRDPMSYYREAPTISTWSKSDFFVAALPFAVILFIVALGMWRLLTGS